MRDRSWSNSAAVPGVPNAGRWPVKQAHRRFSGAPERPWRPRGVPVSPRPLRKALAALSLSLLAVATMTSGQLETPRATAATTLSVVEGDPGNRVLHKMHRALAPAIPSWVSDVTVKDHSTYHHGKCPDNPGGSAGWFAVRVQATFSTARSESAIAEAIGSHLRPTGWSRHDEKGEVYVDGQNYPVREAIPSWTKPWPTGSAWFIALYPDNSGPGMWAMEADWYPPGYSLPGC